MKISSRRCARASINVKQDRATSSSPFFYVARARANELDIPIDIQVARFTFLTGCLKLSKRNEVACIHEPPVQPAIEDVWRNVATSLGIAPWQLDEPIWIVGSKLCTWKNCAPCPVKDLRDKNFDIKIQGNKIYWE